MSALPPNVAKRIDREFLRVPIYQDIYLMRHLLARDIAALGGDLTGRLVDIGCGLKPYESLFPHVTQYVGVDSPSAADGHYRQSTRADVWAAAEALPFKAGEFDAALSVHLAEHLADPLPHVREAARVLKPGGKLLLAAPFVWPLHGLPQDYRRFTAEGLSELVARGGFRVIRTKAQGGLWASVGQLLVLGVLLGALRPGGGLGRLWGWSMKLTLVPFLNVLSRLLDRWLPWEGLALSYLVLAEKPRG